MHLRILFFVCFLAGGSISAQEKGDVYYSGGFEANYGFIIPHASEIEPVSRSKPFGAELVISSLNTSYDSWKVFNSYWFSGIKAGVYDFGNRKVLGNAVLVSAFVEPVILMGGKFFLSARGGAGFSYHTKIFNTIRNPGNKFFSTRISFPLYAAIIMNYGLANSLLVNLSVNYNHISNGGIRQPNFGMNFPTLSLGLRYFNNGLPELHTKYISDNEVRPGLTFFIQSIAAYRVVDATEIYPEKGAFAYGFGFRGSKQLGKHYSLNAGVEMIVDNAIKEMIRRKGSVTDHKRIALTAGEDLKFGKAVFSQILGIYLYSPYKAPHPVYQKYELSYNIRPHFSFGAFLKAHTINAELLGLQVGYSLFNEDSR